METLVNSPLAIQKWRTDYYQEYVRATGLSPYMGKGKNNIYRVVNDLLNQAGKTINIPLINALRGSGVSGSQILVGNEEDLSTANDQVMVDWKRNGVVLPKSSTYVTPIDMMNAAKDANKEWSVRSFKNDSIDALLGIIVPGAALTIGNAADSWVTYANATAGQRNTYLTNNSDRIVFGANLANGSSNVWATALATVDSTNDRLSVATANLAKRVLENTGPDASGAISVSTRTAITPYTTQDGVYNGAVMFCPPNAFRDIQNDSAMLLANRDARPRDVSKNPIFQDGDLFYNDIIFRKMPELRRGIIVGAGTAGINVERCFLCGQAALTVGWGQMPTPRTKKEDDYEFRPGTAIEELRGHKKTSYNGTNYGCVELLVASVDDN